MSLVIRTHADRVPIWGTLPGQPREGTQGLKPRVQGSDLLGSKGQADVKCMFLGVVQAGDTNLGIINLLGMALWKEKVLRPLTPKLHHLYHKM